MPFGSTAHQVTHKITTGGSGAKHAWGITVSSSKNRNSEPSLSLKLLLGIIEFTLVTEILYLVRVVADTQYLMESAESDVFPSPTWPELIEAVCKIIVQRSSLEQESKNIIN